MTSILETRNIERDIRPFLVQAGLDAWVVYNFKQMNPIFADFFGPVNCSRRAFLVITRRENPVLLVHSVDASKFGGIRLEVYTSFEEMCRKLTEIVGPGRKVLMEYSPSGALPAMSFLDAGTFELLSSLGFEIASSAEVYQLVFAIWSDEDLASHRRAAAVWYELIERGFDLIGQNIDRIREDEVVDFFEHELAKQGFEMSAPSVAANAHSGLPHYTPLAGSGSVLRPGDWVMIDANVRQPGAVNADITWVGYAGPNPPADYQRVFDAVTSARDAAVSALAAAFAEGRRIEGWELDRIAREKLVVAGYGANILHRLGHSLGREAHGRGANLDDFETHDTRPLVPGIAFTIEPGVYFPGFGIRSEINVHIGKNGPEVTTPIQKAIRIIDLGAA